MKKKIIGGLTLLFLLTTMTGCVKYNATMDIKNDKSMNFDIIYAFDTEFFGEQQLLKDEERKNLEKKGYTITDYVSGTMNGFTISKKIKNIDSVSDSKDVNYSLASVFQSNDENEKYFKLEKGFLKNKYVAKLNFDSSSSSLNGSNDEELENDVEEELEDDQQDDMNFSDEEHNTEDDSLNIEVEDSEFESSDESNENDDASGLDPDEEESEEDFDFGNMAEMDLSFSVNLPYKSNSNNATNVNNDGKTLEWKLTTDNQTNIEFTFELYNMTTVYCLIGGISVIVIILIVIIIMGMKKRNTKNNINNNENTGNTIQNRDSMVLQTVTQVAPVQTVQPQPVSVQPVTPVPTVQPQPVSVQTAQPQPVSVQPVTPVQTAQPQPVSVQPVTPVQTAQPQPVSVQPVAPVQTVQSQPVQQPVEQPAQSELVQNDQSNNM